jgi:hypothetical protein
MPAIEPLGRGIFDFRTACVDAKQFHYTAPIRSIRAKCRQSAHSFQGNGAARALVLELARREWI